MWRFVIWLILLFILAKMLGVFIQWLRLILGPGPQPKDTVEQKGNRQQFQNIEDADFEDISDKK
jgi:hypothetical protein